MCDARHTLHSGEDDEEEGWSEENKRDGQRIFGKFCISVKTIFEGYYFNDDDVVAAALDEATIAVATKRCISSSGGLMLAG